MKELKGIFFNLLDEKAMDYIAKRVSKMNGDVRVAFDIVKSCFTQVQTMMQSEEGLQEDKIKITLPMVINVF